MLAGLLMQFVEVGVGVLLGLDAVTVGGTSGSPSASTPSPQLDDGGAAASAATLTSEATPLKASEHGRLAKAQRTLSVFIVEFGVTVHSVFIVSARSQRAVRRVSAASEAADTVTDGRRDRLAPSTRTRSCKPTERTWPALRLAQGLATGVASADDLRALLVALCFHQAFEVGRWML